MNGNRLVHVVGAGLAGLSAATGMAELGHHVHLYESTGHAGGRCRSFWDEKAGCMIDNGNHLMLSGNTSTKAYLSRVGAQDRLISPERAVFPFVDLSSGERWICDFGEGAGLLRLLLNGLSRQRLSGAFGIPGVSMIDILSVLAVWCSPDTTTVYDRLGDRGAIYRRLWEPLSVSILNTEPENAMAKAMWPVIRETVGIGPNACRPLLAKEGLSDALVTPALNYLQQTGAKIHFRTALNSLEFLNNNVYRLHFRDHSVEVEAGDKVILALPVAAINEVLPSVSTPNEFRPIVNAHFNAAESASKLTLLGLINGSAQWIFRRRNIVSVTVSAAQALVDEQNDQIAELLWLDVCKALGLGNAPMGRYRIIKEKRATFAQTPEQNRRRPETRTEFDNLFLAGDWTGTGLPATIEGAIRSGEKASLFCV